MNLAARRLYAACLCGSAAIAVPAQAQSTSLQPSADWQVVQNAESCLLSRDFGSGAQLVTLYFNSYGPDDSYRVTLSGENIPRNVGRARVSRITFGREADPQSIVAIDSRSGENGMLNFHLTGRRPAFRYYRGWAVPGALEDPHPELLWPDDLSQLSVENHELGQLTLHLGDMAASLNQLEQCRQALATSWGWDRAKLDRIATPPKLLDPRSTVELMRMPEAQVVNHISLIAQLRINVDEQGRGSNCVVQSPPLEDRAQRALCRPFVGGTPFEPARDDVGNAVPGLFRLHYTYFIFD